MLRKRMDSAPAPQVATQNTAQAVPQTPRDAASEMREINALYSLLDDRYSKSVCPWSIYILCQFEEPRKLTIIAISFRFHRL